MSDVETQVRNYAQTLDRLDPVTVDDVLEVRGSNRRRVPVVVRVAIAAVVVAVVAVAALLSTGPDDTGRRTRVSTPPASEWTTVRDDAHGLSISIPPSWQAAPASLTPVLVDPTMALAIATYPLDDPQRLGECDIVPQRALEALGPTDAFIGVYLYRGTASFGATTERPAHFGPDSPWNGGSGVDHSIQCTQNVKGFVGDLSFVDHDKQLSVLVAIGPDASAQTRADVYAILDTLSVTPS